MIHADEVRRIRPEALGFSVDTGQLHKEPWRFRSVEVVALGGGNALIRRTAVMRASPYIVICIGLIGLSVSYWEITSQEFWHPKVAGVAACILIGGLAFLLGLGMPRVCYLDRESGSLFVGVTKKPLDASRAIQIEDIAALQVIHGVGRYSHFEFSELNVVLTRPPGQRLRLFAHMHPSFAADVEALALILDKPILDAP